MIATISCRIHPISFPNHTHRGAIKTTYEEVMEVVNRLSLTLNNKFILKNI